MFPADHRYWPEPAAARRRFAASAVDLKGTFRIQGLPAGDYFYVVIPDEAAVDWQIASRLETLSRNASRITLADGQSVTLTVR